MLWALCILFLVCIALIKGKEAGYDVSVHLGSGDGTHVTKTTNINEAGETVTVVVTSDADGDDKLEVTQEQELTEDEKQKAAEELNKMPWLRFPQ